jgi:hypothetical protein
MASAGQGLDHGRVNQIGAAKQEMPDEAKLHPARIAQVAEGYAAFAAAPWGSITNFFAAPLSKSW